MTEPKRYDMKWEYPGIVKVESEFGQWVTYSSYQDLLKQFDKLEEAGLGYWLMDEFVLIKEVNCDTSSY